MKPNDAFAVFDNPKNVVVGCGRVCWGEACYPADSPPVDAGWVLPGGRRTQDIEVALDMAALIDSICGGKS